MNVASIYFHQPLHELLRSKNREQLQVIQFKGQQTIKHLAESLGIPHTEIGQIKIAGMQLGFGYIMKSGDIVEVFPASAESDHLSGMFEHEHLVIPARFILDNHLGRLASDLRILGFDADYSNNYQDTQLAEIAIQTRRILLTRDRQLLMRKMIRFGYLVRSLEPDQQLLEILSRFNITSEINLFQRCTRCNHPLEPVEKEEIEHRLEPLTKKYFFDFHICPGCEQIYWAGSHVTKIRKHLLDLLSPGITDDI